jgi:predicted transcriptional regulator of viral defense system
MVLWLQTDRKGVFSHDTALALHHLSDILPSRRHITVPPGWEPPAHARLDRGTVLHHAEMDPSEITWLGPIPFTKPLRTLQDCIDKGISPDLIEQALDEGAQRGMLTQAEVRGLQTAKVMSA